MAAVLVKRSILKLFQSRQLKLFAFKVAKFRTGKICPEIAFTICTKQFHLMKNGHEGLKLMVLKKWNQSFRLEHFFWKTRLSFQMFRCSRRKFFAGATQKVANSVYFKTRFSGNICAKKPESTLKQGKLTA